MGHGARDEWDGEEWYMERKNGTLTRKLYGEFLKADWDAIWMFQSLNLKTRVYAVLLCLFSRVSLGWKALQVRYVT